MSQRSVLRRYLALPTFLFVVVGLNALLTFYFDSSDRRAEAAWDREALHVDGTVLTPYEDGEMRVRYHNPVVNQQVDTDVYPLDERLVPKGRRVKLTVSRVDPQDVTLEGEKWQYEPPLYPLWLVIPLGLFVTRLYTFRATRKSLRQAPGTPMLGVIASPGRFASAMGAFSGWDHPTLHLYPRDATPGTPPVCSVSLVSTAGLPTDTVAFAVEVVGKVRPGRRVVVRVGDSVLWPIGWSRLRIQRDRRLPETILKAVRTPKAATGLPPGREPWFPWATARREIIAFVAALVISAGLGVNLHSSSSLAHRIEAEGKPVIVRVENVDEDDFRLTLSYKSAVDGKTRTQKVDEDFPELFKAGEKYPAHVLDGTSPIIQLDLEAPYNSDVSAPFSFFAMLIGLTGFFFVRRIVRWRRTRNAALVGPWHETDSWLIATNGRATTLALGLFESRHVWSSVRVPTSEAESWVSSATPRRVTVGGDVEPWSAVAVAHDGQWLTVLGPTRTARWLGPWPQKPAVTRTRKPATRRTSRATSPAARKPRTTAQRKAS